MEEQEAEKYFIYIGKNTDGRIDCNYYKKKLNPIPIHLEYVGYGHFKPDYFGKRVVDKFKVLFDNYAKVYHSKQIDGVRELVDNILNDEDLVIKQEYRDRYTKLKG